MTFSQLSQLILLSLLISPCWSGQASGFSSPAAESPELMMAMSSEVSVEDSSSLRLPSLRNSLAVRRTTLQEELYNLRIIEEDGVPPQ